MKKTGFVSIVGAGPGDPKLLTLKALEVLQQAEVILVDRLVSKYILERAADKAKVVYAGKAPDGARQSFKTQQNINAKLIELAQQGKRVVRLKGGDPILFGRGAEEAQALAKAKIPFEIIPGISSAIAAPAYAGIPITHRDHASSFAVVTGHERLKDSDSVTLPEVKADTLVYLMAVKTLPRVVKQLQSHGWLAKTPAALVQWGTCPWQRTVVATLATIVEKAKEAKITAPAVLVVGDVVKVRKEIAWFEKLPLLGKRILVTRPAQSHSQLRDQLMALGADVDHVPAIELAGLKPDKTLRNAVASLPNTDWIFLTSPEGVRFFVELLRRLRRDVRSLAGCHIGAVGRKTADAVAAYGLHVDFVPRSFSHEGMLSDLPKRSLAGKKALIFAAKRSRTVLAKGLKTKGMLVEQLALYDTVMPKTFKTHIVDLVQEPFDLVSATSSSCVEHLYEALKGSRGKFKKLPFASIGPVTSATIRELGGQVILEAKESTAEGLLQAMIQHANKRKAKQKS